MKQERVILTGEDEVYQFRLSSDNSIIALGYRFEKRFALYTIPADGGEKTMVVTTKDDVTPYIIDFTPDNRHLIYETGAYDSKEPHEILRVPLDGGDPEKVILLEDLLSQGKVENIEIHPEGQQIVFDAEVGQGLEVWTLENLFRK